LVVVTGPTGSGKSTTLAAMIDYINESKQNHILTVEDPIEFVHESKRSLINQREVHRDTLGFNEALRSALREDPDVILVGELRDLETISLALTAAETGHLVFGTLHTNSAAKTIDRIIDVFPAGQQQQIRTMLSESLRGVVAQTLFTRADGQGRVAAYEVLRNTKAIANLIREGKLHQIPSAMQTGAAHGMILFEKYIEELVKKGKVSTNDAKTFLGSAGLGDK
jgi:twitching motility protein PilT